jgi:hypothetical protein
VERVNGQRSRSDAQAPLTREAEAADWLHRGGRRTVIFPASIGAPSRLGGPSEDGRQAARSRALRRAKRAALIPERSIRQCSREEPAIVNAGAHSAPRGKVKRVNWKRCELRR